MRFERTFDLPLVERILTEPACYRAMADDDSPPRELFRAPDDPNVWYVLASDDAGPCGLFIFVPQKIYRWEVHVAMLPSAWGARAWEAGRAIAHWVWSHTPCLNFCGAVAAHNTLTIRYAERAMGMRRIGRFENGFVYRGKRADEILFDLARPE